MDDAYERAGTASIFRFAEPLAGWRRAAARPQQTKVAGAWEVAALLEGRDAKCSRVILVCDNLSRHARGAYYEAFEPARACDLVRRLQFCRTPEHGSWLRLLNERRAENERSSLTRQCVSGRRFGKLTQLQAEILAWSIDVNTTARGVDWQTKIDDARCKLTSLDPKIKV